jgi:hypothetical protein
MYVLALYNSTNFDHTVQTLIPVVRIYMEQILATSRYIYIVGHGHWLLCCRTAVLHSVLLLS